jgi:hypothetical protein
MTNKGIKLMRANSAILDDAYVSQLRNKVAPLLTELRGNVTEREAASRLGVGVHLYLDWEKGLKVPPSSERLTISKYTYDGVEKKSRRSSFVRIWSGLASAWGWAPISEAEWNFHDIGDRQVQRPELRSLLSDWASVVSDGIPRVRFLDGDHGSGKTTLVNGLLADVVHGSSDCVAAAASCPELPQGQGYGILKELIAEVVQQRVGPKLRQRDADLIRRDMLWKAPGWRKSILDGFEKAARLCPKLDDRTGTMTYTEKAMNGQYLELLRYVVQNPTLVFIDNLQWADLSSLSLLLQFIKSTSDDQYPIYLVVAFRHFEAHATGALETSFRRFFRESLEASSVLVSRLGDGIDVSEFLKKRYPGYSLPSTVHALAEVATRGNPWLLCNVFDELDHLGKPQRVPKAQVSYLMDDWRDFLGRLISGTSTEPAQDNVSALTIKELRDKIGDAVLEMRLAQLDRLSMRKLLDQASVEWSVGGEGFTVEVLARASAMDEPYVYIDLSDLEHNYLLVRTRPQSHLEATNLTLYEFWYWLYGSYIYERVPPGFRPKLHLLVAESLRVLYVGSPRFSASWLSTSPGETNR